MRCFSHPQFTRFVSFNENSSFNPSLTKYFYHHTPHTSSLPRVLFQFIFETTLSKKTNHSESEFSRNITSITYNGNNNPDKYELRE